MPDAAPLSSRRKGRRPSCLPSCFTSSAVKDSDDSPARRPEKPPARSPEAFFRSRVCRQNKTIPLLEEIVAEGGEIKREVPSPVISPAANSQKLMPEKLRKVEKKCRITGTKPFIHKPLSTCPINKRSNNQHSNINHQPTTTLHKMNHHGPIQTRTRAKMIHSGSSDPTRPIYTSLASRRPDILIGLEMVAIMLATTVIGGKFFAVFITTICFYFLSCVGQSQSPTLVSSTQKL